MGLDNNALEQTVGAKRRLDAPPAGDAQRWADQRMIRPSTSLAVLATIVLGVFGFAPSVVRVWILGAALLLLGACLARPRSPVTVWCLLVATIVGLKTVLPAYDIWPLHLAAPLLLVACYSTLGPAPTPFASWARPGSFSLGVRVLTAVITAAAAGGFAVWVAVANPQIHAPQSVRHLSPVAVALVGCAFASVNAAIEELAFRGIALGALSSVCKSPWLAVLLQAVAFGALHYASPSIPSGLAGAGLTFLYGAALGHLANLADGIFAPWLAHFVADMIVFMAMMRGV